MSLTTTMTEAAKYFTKYKLVPQEMEKKNCKEEINTASLPINGQKGSGSGSSKTNDYVNRLKLLQMQENGDLYRL